MPDCLIAARLANAMEAVLREAGDSTYADQFAGFGWQTDEDAFMDGYHQVAGGGEFVTYERLRAREKLGRFPKRDTVFAVETPPTREELAESRTLKGGGTAGVATIGAAGVEVAQEVPAETQGAILPMVPYLDTPRLGVHRDRARWHRGGDLRAARRLEAEPEIITALLGGIAASPCARRAALRRACLSDRRIGRRVHALTQV